MNIADIDKKTFDLTVKHPDGSEEAARRDIREISEDLSTSEMGHAELLTEIQGRLGAQLALGVKQQRWKTRPLGEICQILDNRRKPITKRDRVAGEYPYYGATGILDYVHDYLFDEPLVLIGEDGAKWGAGENTAFAATGKYWVNNHAHVIRPNRTVVLDKWIISFLNHANLLDFVSGMTVPKLNQGRMREIPIPVPPLDEQERMISAIEEMTTATRKLKANCQKITEIATELDAALLSQAFDGQL